MNFYKKSVSRRFFVCFILGVLAWPGFCQTATWTGQVQCQLSVQSAGYTHQETQTWAISGMPTASGAIEVYPANWSSNGKGAVQQPTRTAQWTVNVQPMNAPLAVFIRSSDNRLVIKSYHSQLYSPAGVTGNQILPTQGSLQFPTSEWTLPVIEDSPTSVNVSGSATVAIAPNLLPLQTSSSPASTANCNWQFSKVTGGIPQPVIAAKAVAMPTGLPTSTTTSTTTTSIPLTAPTSQVVALILGRTSDGATCSQPNPMPDINSGLSHAFESTCTIQFSGAGWNDVASWNLPPPRMRSLSPSTPSVFRTLQILVLPPLAAIQIPCLPPSPEQVPKEILQSVLHGPQLCTCNVAHGQQRLTKHGPRSWQSK